MTTFFRRSPSRPVGRSESTLVLLQTRSASCKPLAEVLAQETGDKRLAFNSGDVRLPTLAILEGLHDDVELFESTWPSAGNSLVDFSQRHDLSDNEFFGA
jgi:hypothetical protein